MKDHEKFVRMEVGGISWRVAEGSRQLPLFTSGSGRIEGELLRATPHRRVSRVQGKTCSLLVKQFFVSGIWRSLKASLRGSPADREWKALHEARRRGLPIPTPLALGSRGKLGNREWLLITEFIEEAVSLGQFLFGPNRFTGSVRRWVIEETARLLRLAHDAGFYQTDLHTDNILLRSVGKQPDLFLIDLQRVNFTSSLSLRSRWRNLSILNGGCLEASLADRVRFLRSYLSSGRPLAVEFREVAALLEKHGQKHRFHLWRSRTKRCLDENREFLKVAAGEFSGFARRNLWRAEFQALFEELYESRFHLDIRSVERLSLPGGNFSVKKYRCGGLGGALKSLFCASQARTEWLAANAVRMRGIAVATPVACLERRLFLIIPESYLITEDPEGETVSAVLSRLAVTGPVLPDKTALISSLASWVRKMHACGVSGVEFGNSNIVVRMEDTGKFHFSVLAWGNVRFGPLSRRRRVRDIVNLGEASKQYGGISRTDRLRFLETYLGFREREKWKEIWRSAAYRSRIVSTGS